MITETDCRSEEGITVGLIDSLISISRILSKRDMSSGAVQEALKDLHNDEDVDYIFRKAVCLMDSVIGDQQTKLFNVYAVLQEKDDIIEQRNNMLSQMHSELELTKVHLKGCREKIWKVKGAIDE
jgi:hypothetical protein